MVQQTWKVKFICTTKRPLMGHYMHHYYSGNFYQRYYRRGNSNSTDMTNVSPIKSSTTNNAQLHGMSMS